MRELQVSAWKRYGHDRLYVNVPGGEKVAWLDRGTGQLTVLVEEYREAVLDALAPHVTAAPSSPAEPPRPVLPARDDLAQNRPGEALLAKLDEIRPSFWRYLLTRLLGRPSETDSWRKGLVGEQKAGAELERLTAKGWRVLHSIPLAREVDIDHLLIGPGGVFSVNTKHHRDARVWVGDDSVRIGGHAYPYVRKSRAESRRASAALTRACGRTVDVRPILAFVGAATLTVVPTLHDVRVVHHREIAALKSLKGVWTPADTEAVYAKARDRRIWPTT